MFNRDSEEWLLGEEKSANGRKDEFVVKALKESPVTSLAVESGG